MYVCVCRAVTDSMIRRAVAEGACSLRDLRNDLGLGTGCGKCVPQAHQVLRDCLEEKSGSQPARPSYGARTA